MDPDTPRADFAAEPTSEAASSAAATSEPEARAAPIVEAQNEEAATYAAPTAEAQREEIPTGKAEPQETPSAQGAGPAAPEPPAPELPRRRSTVREPAPQAWRDDTIPVPSSVAPPVPSIEPVVTSSAGDEESDRPRRSGWWSRRALGKS